MKPTIISLFAGIGGLDLAAHWAGFETIRFVEKEPFCQQILRKHWPGVPVDDDVFTCHPPPADVVIGGFPCQPFSSSGRRKGKDDERYLLPEMLRIVGEVQPYAVLFENVQNFPKLDNGDGFKYLLRTLAEMGYDAEWGHLFAADVGSPQSRERWFCVAYTNGESVQRNNRTMGETAQHTGQSQIRGDSVGGSQTSQWRNPKNAESRMGRVINGLPCRMDFVGWPAGRGKEQYQYEPPRLSIATKQIKARQSALGNAVVPQVAYPIFAALMEVFIHGFR